MSNAITEISMVKGESGDNDLFVKRGGKVRCYEDVKMTSLVRLSRIVNKTYGWDVQQHDNGLLVTARKPYGRSSKPAPK